MFQSTHPCGVRLECKPFLQFLLLFQSTHPCGVRLKDIDQETGKYRFQSTHPCGVRHTHYITLCTDCYVSIHAPLRGATEEEEE